MMHCWHKMRAKLRFTAEFKIKFWCGRLIKYDIYHIIVWRSLKCSALALDEHIVFLSAISDQKTITTYFLISSHQHRQCALCVHCVVGMASSNRLHGQTRILFNSIVPKSYGLRQPNSDIINIVIILTQQWRIFLKENQRRCLVPVTPASHEQFTESFGYPWTELCNRILMNYFRIFVKIHSPIRRQIIACYNHIWRVSIFSFYQNFDEIKYWKNWTFETFLDLLVYTSENSNIPISYKKRTDPKICV